MNSKVAWIDKRIEAEATAVDTGGGGGDDGGMESRLAKLESHVEHIDTTLSDIKEDIRELRRETSKLLWAGVGAAFVLLGVYGAGYMSVMGALQGIVAAIHK